MNNHLKHLGIIIDSHQLSDLVVRASALRLGGWGSIPGRVIPKTIEKGPNSSVFMHHHNHHHYRVSELENPHHSRTGCCTDTCQYRLSSSLCRNICQKSSLFYTCIGPSQGWPLGLGGPLWLLVSAIHPFAV